MGYGTTSIGLTTCLNRTQEVILSTAIGVSSVYNPPFASKAFGHYYDDLMVKFGNAQLKILKGSGRGAKRASVSIAKRTAKSMGKRGALRIAGKSVGKLATRAIPVVGWALLVYDIVDWMVGDDPSLIGDIIDLYEWATG